MARNNRRLSGFIHSRNIGWVLRQRNMCKDDEKIVIRNGWPAIERKDLTEMTIDGIERFFRRLIHPEKHKVH